MLSSHSCDLRPLAGGQYVLGPQALLAGIMGQLEAMLDVLAAQGFAPLQAAYLEAWLHTGQQVCKGFGSVIVKRMSVLSTVRARCPGTMLTILVSNGCADSPSVPGVMTAG